MNTVKMDDPYSTTGSVQEHINLAGLAAQNLKTTRYYHQEPVRFPDFLGVGVQKCGTSWLDDHLRSHPALWLPAIKEIHYFDARYISHSHDDPEWPNKLRKIRVIDSLKWHFERVAPESWDFAVLAQLAHIGRGALTDEWYGTVFAAAAPHQLCGEFTPDYAYLPDAGIAHLKSLSPDLKIIISLRDPIDRAWSEIRMVAQDQGLSSESDLHDIAAQAEVIQRSDYAELLTRWGRFIPAERICVTFVDDIARSPQSVMDTVCTFLDVPADAAVFQDLEHPINLGETRPMPPGLYKFLKQQLRGRYREFAHLYPERAREWAARHDF